jgi:hypothetical protein
VVVRRDARVVELSMHCDFEVQSWLHLQWTMRARTIGQQLQQSKLQLWFELSMFRGQEVSFRLHLPRLSHIAKQFIDYKDIFWRIVLFWVIVSFRQWTNGRSSLGCRTLAEWMGWGANEIWRIPTWRTHKDNWGCSREDQPS